MADHPAAASTCVDPDQPPRWTEQEPVEAIDETLADVAAGRMVERDDLLADLRDALAATHVQARPDQS